METYAIYHQVRPGMDCPDGIVAAWVASLACPVKIVGRAYNDPRPWPLFPIGSQLLLVDFSVDYGLLCKWEADGHEIMMIDHHKTAMENFQDLESLMKTERFFDMAECGASLAWKIIHDGPVPSFLAWIRSRDLWLDCNLFSDPISETLLFHEWHGMQRNTLKPNGHDDPTDLFGWYSQIKDLCADEIMALALADGVEDALQEKRQQILDIATRAVEFSVDWLPPSMGTIMVPCVTLDPHEDRLVSDICTALYTRFFPNAPFVYCKMSDGSYSLRSNPTGSNTDVSIIARHNGGGGHRNAAGFKPVWR